MWLHASRTCLAVAIFFAVCRPLGPTLLLAIIALIAAAFCLLVSHLSLAEKGGDDW